MRKFLILALPVLFVLAACSTTPAQTPIVKQLLAAPTAQPTPFVVHTTAINVKVGASVAAVAYGCGHVGISVGLSEVVSNTCDQDTQTEMFVMKDGLIISAQLSTMPANPLVGETVTINTSVKSLTEIAGCVLLDEQTRQPIEQTFPVVNDTGIRAECSFKNGDKVTLGYTIRPLPGDCVPEFQKDFKTPTDFSLSYPGTYVLELSFPNVTGVLAQWVGVPSWTEYSSDGSTSIAFTGAVGTIYKFAPGCNPDNRLKWETQNLKSVPGLLSNWESADVVTH